MEQSNKNIINAPKVYRIDAKEKPIGRLASEISAIIQGKRLASYRPEKLANIQVVIKNVKDMVATGKKLSKKVYYRYSGYPGGIKIKKMSDMFISNPEKFLLKVIENMLPKNKLRSGMLKKIQFKKDDKK